MLLLVQRDTAESDRWRARNAFAKQSGAGSTAGAGPRLRERTSCVAA